MYVCLCICGYVQVSDENYVFCHLMSDSELVTSASLPEIYTANTCAQSSEVKGDKCTKLSMNCVYMYVCASLLLGD